MRRLWSGSEDLLRRADEARGVEAWSKAAKLYRRVLARAPYRGHAAIWLHLGTALEQMGDPVGSRDAYERAAVLSPEEAEPHERLAALHSRAGAPGKAHAAWARAKQREHSPIFAIAPGDWVAMADRARDDGRWAEAARHYQRHLTENGYEARLLVQLGNMRKEEGFHDAALAAYRAALDLEPSNADTHLQVGRLLDRMGAGSRACLAFSRALALDPTLSDARRELDSAGCTGPAIPSGWQDMNDTDHDLPTRGLAEPPGPRPLPMLCRRFEGPS